MNGGRQAKGFSGGCFYYKHITLHLVVSLLSEV